MWYLYFIAANVIFTSTDVLYLFQVPMTYLTLIDLPEVPVVVAAGKLEVLPGQTVQD